MLPKVSIIIPVYNVEPYIEECLQSVIRQSYKGMIECVLVDDCGTDKSMEIAERLIADYDGPIEFKVVHHEYNRGLSAARNTGIDVSCGEYIYFLDSDDWISDDCIEKLVQPLGLEQYDFVVGHCEWNGKDSFVTCSEGEYHKSGMKSDGRSREKNKPIGRIGIPVAAWNKLFRKCFLVDNQLYFEVGKILEDSIFSFDLACVERKYYVVSSITYHYRHRENSITTTSNRFAKIKGFVGLFQSLRDRVRQDKYRNLNAIYDYYLFWVKRVFQRISTIEMDEKMLAYVQEETKGFLDVIPSIRYLSNKHDRLIYFFCIKDQTYLRFQYVWRQYTDKYANRLSGKIMRNILGLIPEKKAKCF